MQCSGYILLHMKLPASLKKQLFYLSHDTGDHCVRFGWAVLPLHGASPGVIGGTQLMAGLVWRTIWWKSLQGWA